MFWFGYFLHNRNLQIWKTISQNLNSIVLPMGKIHVIMLALNVNTPHHPFFLFFIFLKEKHFLQPPPIHPNFFFLCILIYSNSKPNQIFEHFFKKKKKKKKERKQNRKQFLRLYSVGIFENCYGK